MLDVVRRFNLYNGGGALPPRWGLGFWHRVPTLFSDKEVNEEVAKFEKRGFPLSVVGLEPGWMSRSYPWTYEWDKTRFPEVEKEVQEIARLRIQLIPYLYTAFADYAFEGTPPVRAMNLEEGYQADSRTDKGVLDATENPYAMAVKREVKDQFMVGPSLLVAPLFVGEKERQVILPQGKWYDFYTGEFAGEGEVITVSPGLEKIPV
jgi:alpha-D-xyloside xylohydrolase